MSAGSEEAVAMNGTDRADSGVLEGAVIAVAGAAGRRAAPPC